MFSKLGFWVGSRVSFLATTLMVTTLGLIGFSSFLPPLGLAQNSPNYLPQRPRINNNQSCALLVQKLELSAPQQGEALAVCDRFHGILTSSCITALRAILDPVQSETFNDRVSEVRSLMDLDCIKSDRRTHPNYTGELKCR